MESESYTGMRAMPALAMAVLEQSGICGSIDSLVKPDPQRILTPGKAAKFMVGGLYFGMGRRALYKFDRLYATAPLEMLCGKPVEPSNLNSRAFSRALDDLFGLDLPALSFDCYETLARRYGIAAVVYNMDSTNFGVDAVVIEADRDGAAIPEWNGHAKDGDNSRRVYNLQSVTDSNGIVCYERPYDGSTADSEMDRDTIAFLATRMDPRRSTVVADSKIVNADLVRMMGEAGFGFVSKCPGSFGSKVRDDIVYSVMQSTMEPSSYAPGWGVYDCDAEVDGVNLRFVAFTVPDDGEHGVDYHRRQDGKRVADAMRRLGKRKFACAEDARRAFEEARRKLEDTACVIEGDIVETMVQIPRKGRGRPPADYVPEYRPEYSVEAQWWFSERLAEEMVSERGVRVLVTNIPRANETLENPRDGATADDVLRLYLGQYRIEHSFRTSKSVFDVDKVYLHTPSRANAFMFVVSLATMLSGVIRAAMYRAGVYRTAEAMMDDLTNLDIVVGPDGRPRLFGDPDSCREFNRYLEVLGIDGDRIFSCG